MKNRDEIAAKAVHGLLTFIRESSGRDSKKYLNIKDRVVDEFSPIYLKDIPEDFSEITTYSDDQLDSDVVLSIEAAVSPTPVMSPHEFLEKIQSMNDQLVSVFTTPVEGEEQSDKDSVLRFFSLIRDIQRLRFFKAWLLRFSVWVKENNRYLAVSRWYDVFWQMRRFLAEKSDYVCVLGNAMMKSHDGLHPLFGRSVVLDLTTEGNPVITLRLCQEEEGTVFYGDLLKVKSSSTRVNTNACNNLTSQLPYTHPLCRSSLGETFRKFIAEFSSGGCWEESADNASKRDLPYVLYYEPVLFLQKRESGIKQSLDKFRHALNNGMVIPPHVTDILLGHEEQSKDELNPSSSSEHESAMSVMGEEESVLTDRSAVDEDVLWILPANKEQMKIAQKARKNHGVVVQGPPGTGKTHMIVNLLGHFLSLGKRVLVVGQKAKALSVIQDKLDPKFCGLCVSATQDGSKGSFSTEAGLMALLSDAEESSIDQLYCSEKTEVDIRQKLSKELQETRKKMRCLRDREHQGLVLRGESFSLSKLGAWLRENEEYKHFGPFSDDETWDLSQEELQELYHISRTLPEVISAYVNDDFDSFPDPSKLSDCEQLELGLQSVANAEKIVANSSLRVDILADGYLLKHQNKYSMRVTTSQAQSLLEIANFLDKFPDRPDGEEAKLLLEGRYAGSCYLKTRWNRLISLMTTIIDLSLEERSKADDVVIHIPEDMNISLLENAIQTCLDKCRSGNISALFKLRWHKYWRLIELVRINGKILTSLNDLKNIMVKLQLEKERKVLRSLWDKFDSFLGALPTVCEGDPYPELRLNKKIQRIHDAVHWHSDYADQLSNYMKQYDIQVNKEARIQSGEYDERREWDESYAEIYDFILPALRTVCKLEANKQLERFIANTESELKICKNKGNKLASYMHICLDDCDFKEYDVHLSILKTLFQFEDNIKRRQELLRKLALYAPAWADAIRAGNEPILKAEIPPVLDVCKWAYLNKQWDELYSEDYSTLHGKAEELLLKLRAQNVTIATLRARIALMKRLASDPRLLTALKSWRYFKNKAGQGKSKLAMQYMEAADRDLKLCYRAIPAWITTVEHALKLFAGETKFDIVILDEASQADLKAFPILLLCDQIIVVGDDKQFTPFAVGQEAEDIQALSDQYLVKEIQHRERYQSGVSLYELANICYPSSMLREHFRCVPAIIEYCNSLAYGGRILPLRNNLSEQLQPWVTYRVEGKYTGRKENVQEAEAVVDLIQACIQEPEYEGKTFGIIILRSSESMKKMIDRLLSRSLDKTVIDERKIICGNAEDFQGDERDVIFLLFLNSAEDHELLSKIGSGHNEENIKRYNVAVSRAKDQVWLIHSFCPRSALKPGDLRCDLFQHAQNPYANENKITQVAELSESDFEQRVAKDLIYRKYCLQQQFPVGNYRLDMVIRYKDKSIALECDGDRYHSRPEQIQRDEEREEILSRAGWKFIRIRGGEYYRDPEGTIEHVCKQLKNFGIEPCEDLIDSDFEEYKETQLTLKIKNYAHKLQFQRKTKMS